MQLCVEYFGGSVSTRVSNHDCVSTLFQTDNSVLNLPKGKYCAFHVAPFAPLVINFIFDRKYPGFLLNDGTDN